jgi:hypothetical protein
MRTASAKNRANLGLERPYLAWLSSAAQVGLVLGTAAVQQGSGPFSSIWSVALDWVLACLVASGVVLILSAVPWWLVYCLADAVFQRRSTRSTVLLQAAVDALSSMLLPLLGYTAWGMLEFSGRATTTIGGTRPRGLPSTHFAELDFRLAVIYVAMFWVAFCIGMKRAKLRLSRDAERSCRRCGYSGAGLAANVKCPECGEISGRPLWT